MILHNLTDKQCRNIIKEISIDEIEICDGDTHRPLTLDDVKNFETLS